MKTSRYTEAKIIAILRQAEGGVPVAELRREHVMPVRVEQHLVGLQGIVT
jgi:hypothetical protein